MHKATPPSTGKLTCLASADRANGPDMFCGGRKYIVGYRMYAISVYNPKTKKIVWQDVNCVPSHCSTHLSPSVAMPAAQTSPLRVTETLSSKSRSDENAL
jgi:hypothetical protein